MIISVVGQSSPLCDKKDQPDDILETASSQLRALDIHIGDQAVLSMQKDAERVNFGDPFDLKHIGGRVLHFQINLVRRAPNAKDRMLSCSSKSSDQAGRAASHCALAVRSDAKQFTTPRSVQRVHKLADRIKYYPR
uniref:Uncharacterized protein n=1 Tax=Peronospora matthiolae TaxID=2874970 RepID=A0AAV1TYC3_9STRA